MSLSLTAQVIIETCIVTFSIGVTAIALALMAVTVGHLIQILRGK
jgi:hypothetical protein